MDDRTYPDELARLRAEVKRLESELTLRLRQLMRANAEDRLWLMKTERLTHDLADAQTVATLQRELHADELGQCVSENTQLAENAAELGKALDVCIAERDSAFAEVDAQTLKANSFRGELHRYMQHAIELKDMLDISVAERDALRAELDAERNAHNATAAQLYAELAGAQDTATAAVQAWRTVTAERDALRAERDDYKESVSNLATCALQLRAELDAMRQAHSVVAARMAAMGC